VHMVAMAPADKTVRAQEERGVGLPAALGRVTGRHQLTASVTATSPREGIDSDGVALTVLTDQPVSVSGAAGLRGGGGGEPASQRHRGHDDAEVAGNERALALSGSHAMERPSSRSYNTRAGRPRPARAGPLLPRRHREPAPPNARGGGGPRSAGGGGPLDAEPGALAACARRRGQPRVRGRPA
jgi:hypothetical protein